MTVQTGRTLLVVLRCLSVCLSVCLCEGGSDSTEWEDITGSTQMSLSVCLSVCLYVCLCVCVKVVVTVQSGKTSPVVLRCPLSITALHSRRQSRHGQSLLYAENNTVSFLSLKVTL